VQDQRGAVEALLGLLRIAGRQRGLGLAQQGFAFAQARCVGRPACGRLQNGPEFLLGGR